MKKSIFGLTENIAGALSYGLCFLSGIGVLILEKDNKNVRFHALQSTIWFIFLMVLQWGMNILTRVPLLGFAFGFASWALGLVWFVSWVYLMYMAYKGNVFKLPIIGEVVWTQVNK